MRQYRMDRRNGCVTGRTSAGCSPAGLQAQAACCKQKLRSQAHAITALAITARACDRDRVIKCDHSPGL